MAEDKWVVNGYIFDNKQEYEKAKKELEAIVYIKNNTKLEQADNTLKIYNKIIEKQTFETVVGYEFLKQLRYLILKAGILETQIQNIPIKNKKTKRQGQKEIGKIEKEEKYKQLYEGLKGKRDSAKVVILFLVLIIGAMFAITFYNRQFTDTSSEEKIVDKYANWQQELEAKEQELEKREKELYKE